MALICLLLLVLLLELDSLDSSMWAIARLESEFKMRRQLKKPPVLLTHSPEAKGAGPEVSWPWLARLFVLISKPMCLNRTRAGRWCQRGVSKVGVGHAEGLAELKTKRRRPFVNFLSLSL